MKRIFFYSSRGVDTQVFLPLLFKIPTNYQVVWLVQEPQLGPFMYMDHAAVSSLEELGIEADSYDRNSTRRKLYTLLKRKHGLFSGDLISYRRTRMDKLFPKKRKFSVVSTYRNVGDILKSERPDAVLITSLWVHRDIVSYMKGGATPFFFHAYGNTFKEKSGFEWRSKQGKFLSAIFSMGPKEYEQSKFLGIRQERTGGSKLDLFTFPEIFKVPVKKPFVLYCSTISNTRIYPKELSEPEKWAPYLEDIFNSTGFEFVAKWHPNSTQKFKKMKLVKNTYLPTYQYDVLRQANIIVADPTSLLPDALIVNKPLFLIKTPLDEWGYYRRFKKGCYMIVGNRQKDRGLILKVMNKDWLKNERKKLIKEWWYKPDGNASERVWKQISKLV